MTKKPLLTYILIIINLVVFIAIEWVGDTTNTITMIKYGAKFDPLIWGGDWWRLVSPIFLHYGIIHLGMNMLTLFFIGPMVERIYGRARFLIIYLIAGIAGVAASFAILSSVSAGASGAIFGLFGALLYYGFIQKNQHIRIDISQLVGLIIVNLAIGFSQPGIDNSAHIGGFIGGFLLANIVSLPRVRFQTKQMFTAILMGAILIGFIYYGYHKTYSKNDYLIGLSVSGEFIDNKEYGYAEKILSNYLENDDPEFADAQMYQGFLLLRQSKFAEGATYLQNAIKMNPQLAPAYAYLADAYYLEGDVDLAIQTVTKAIEINPDYKDFQKQLENYQELKGKR